jgi:hypothetical protein
MSSAKGLREAIESLRKLSPALNQITDTANITVREIEQFLNEECSIGICASVSVPSLNDEQIDSYLEYRRVGPRFRIALVETNSADGRDFSVKPWADCPRHEKLESIKHIGELLNAIAVKAQTQIADATTAVREVASTIATLRKTDGSDSDSRKSKATVDIGLTLDDGGDIPF